MRDVKLTLVIKRPALVNEKGYLGLVAENMQPNEGEDWLRGSDAADGAHTEETLERVIKDIKSFFYSGVKSHE